MKKGTITAWSQHCGRRTIMDQVRTCISSAGGWTITANQLWWRLQLCLQSTRGYLQRTKSCPNCVLHWTCLWRRITGSHARFTACYEFYAIGGRYVARPCRKPCDIYFGCEPTHTMAEILVMLAHASAPVSATLTPSHRAKRPVATDARRKSVWLSS